MAHRRRPQQSIAGVIYLELWSFGEAAWSFEFCEKKHYSDRVCFQHFSFIFWTVGEKLSMICAPSVRCKLSYIIYAYISHISSAGYIHTHTCMHHHNQNCDYDTGHPLRSYKRTPPVRRFWRLGQSQRCFLLSISSSLILAKGPHPSNCYRGSQDRSVIWSYHSHSAFLKSNFFLHLFKDIYWRYANKWCIFNTFEEYVTVTLCSARFSDLYPMLHFRNRIFSLCCSNFLQPAVWGVTPNTEGVLMRITICASVEGANAQRPQWLPLKNLFSDCVLFESRDKGGSTSLWHPCFKMLNWCLSFSPVDMQWRCTMILHNNYTVV